MDRGSKGDPPADAVIAELVSTGRIDQVNAVLAHFRSNDAPIPDELPPLVRQYLLDTRHLPAWADTGRIARAYDFFVDDGVDVASVPTISVRQLTTGEPTALTIPDELRDRWEATGVCPAPRRRGAGAAP